MEKSIIFILLSMLLSCTGNKAYDQQLSKADSIMDIADDSAQIAIKMLDALKPEWSKFTKAQRMRYDLLYHKAMNKAYIDFTSDSTMLAVVDYYEHHGTANDRMLAYYILGCVYRDMHEAPMALEYYNKATEQADTAAQDCDYATLCRVYSQMGFLFAKQHLPHQELASFNKATQYAYKAKDTLNAIRYYVNLKSATYRVSWEFTCKTTKILLLYIFLGHNRNVVNTKFPYPITRLEVIRRFNQKSMAFNQSLS